MVDQLTSHPLVYDVVELFEGFSTACLEAANLRCLVCVDCQVTWVIWFLLLVGKLCSARSSEAKIRHFRVFLDSVAELLFTIGEVFRGVQDFL